MSSFSHLDDEGKPKMVDVSNKNTSRRTAIARSIVTVDSSILAHLSDEKKQTKKGPVFQTAILAGIMASKQTSQLIPLCHPLMISKSNIDIHINENKEVVILCEVSLDGKTGVEMEALTGASVAALTIYDMCKGISQNMSIKETTLIKKTGGKSDINRS